MYPSFLDFVDTTVEKPRAAGREIREARESYSGKMTRNLPNDSDAVRICSSYVEEIQQNVIAAVR